MEDQLRQALDKLAGVEPETLRREGRDFDFTDVHRILAEAIRTLRSLRDDPDFWDLYPQDQKQQATAHIAQFASLVDRIQGFAPKQLSNPQQERDGLANEVRRLYGELYTSLFQAFRIREVEKRFELDTTRLSDEARKLVEVLQQQKTQAEQILNAMQTAAARAGLSRFAAVFAEEVHRRERAGWWLLGIIVSAAALAGFLWWSVEQFSRAVAQAANATEGLQQLIAKLVLLSFVSFVFYQLIKNYNANQHLAALNRHRANTLETFQTFVEASSDPQVRDAVLVHAARAIFEAGPTGYVSSSPSLPAGETIRILDRLKAE